MTVALSSAAHAMNHPYSSEEEAALSAFRARDVDLTREDTGFGRALRDVVIQQCEGLSGRESFPPLLSGRSFGAGSFARRTLCRPLDDIDVYLVLDACGAPMSEHASGPSPPCVALAPRWLPSLRMKYGRTSRHAQPLLPAAAHAS